MPTLRPGSPFYQRREDKSLQGSSARASQVARIASSPLSIFNNTYNQESVAIDQEFKRSNAKFKSDVNPVQIVPAGSTHAPGGVLAYDKWNVLEENSVNIDEAVKSWTGNIVFGSDGVRRYVIDVNQFPMQEIKRQEIIHEIITTEMEYVRDLKIIVNVLL